MLPPPSRCVHSEHNKQELDLVLKKSLKQYLGFSISSTLIRKYSIVDITSKTQLFKLQTKRLKQMYINVKTDIAVLNCDLESR